MGNALNLRAGASLACLVLLLSAACTSNPTPAPTSTLSPTPTLHLSTHEGTIQPATLPPSWTPTDTRSPSSTPTPTSTASATPVPSLADLCASFTVDSAFEDEHIFFWGDTITLMFGTPLRLVRSPSTDTVVPVRTRFLAAHVASGENLGVQGDGGQTHVMELAASRLTEPGYYTWKVFIYGDDIGERCVHEGSFYVYPSAEAVPPTEEATAES